MSRPTQAIGKLLWRNNVPHSLNKTRRTWRANVKRFSLPVNVLDGAVERTLATNARLEAQAASGSVTPSKRRPRFPEFRRVKMTQKGIKSVEKAGGLEALLLTRAPKHFTPYGKKLRTMLFTELHTLRKLAEADSEDQQMIRDKAERELVERGEKEVPLIERK